MSMRYPASQAHTAEECAELEYLLLGDLQELMEEQLDETNRRWLLAVLDTLVEISDRHIRLADESGGYLSELLNEFPNWDRRVDRLRERRLRVNDSIRELRDRIDSREDVSAVAVRIRVDIREWICEYMEQRRHEIQLMQTAYNWEIGGLG
ncbi:MAG: hypothetical protein KDA85_08040 [Planctomycetaceae bacterium]|nr:hypothetical protein [Planctomycetaceae bacterium]